MTNKWLIILSSLFIDIAFVIIMIYYILYAKTGRIVYSVIIFYGIRGLCQGLFLFQFSPELTFSFPGIYSIMVPYGKTSDFYFSGHSGFLFMSTLEFIHMKLIGVAFLNFISMIYTGWLLVVTRAHYSIGNFFFDLPKTSSSAGCLGFTPTGWAFSTRKSSPSSSGTYFVCPSGNESAGANKDWRFK